MAEDERTRPTFAGAVAALWLEYVHGLVQVWSDNGPGDDKFFWALCDRIEGLLKHLENSSMPIPGMTLEDVIEMGREIDADMATEELDERAADYLDSSSRAREKVTEKGAGAEQASGGGADGAEEASKPPRGYCANCGHHGASNAHRDACLQGKPRKAQAENLRCKGCGYHVRSNTHRVKCLGRVQTPPTSDPPRQEGGAIKCKRCGGHTYLDGEDDIVCLQCGDRVVGPQFGAAPA